MATSRFTKSISWTPLRAFHAATRCCAVAMGVRLSHPSSVSMLRRLRLSTMMTLCPFSLRLSDVGHPQNPSPPRTMTFFAADAAMRVDAAVAIVRDGTARGTGAKAVHAATVRQKIPAPRMVCRW